MQFMSGRYGPDELFYLLFIIASLLSLINIFLRLAVLQFLVYAIIIFALFRMFSRNIESRRKEARFISNLKASYLRKKNLTAQKKADKLHVYKTCPRCRAVLRLPHRVGQHKTVCPKCNKEFTVRVRK